MYTEFYKFTSLPFQLTPDARFFYSSSVHSRALSHLTYGLSQGEGFIVITGDIGAGKTTLVEHLLDRLDPGKFTAAKVTNTQLNADDTLRLVASAFGVQSEATDKATLLKRIETFLQRTAESNRRALLLIDECQNLSIPALEELRMLSNIQFGGKVPLQSFLLGQPQFRDTLARPELDQLRQRVLASYHLGPLSPDETRAYVEHRLRTVGWRDDPRLEPDVFTVIFEHTGGIPRRINTLCSRLLLFGFLEERHSLAGEHAQDVAKDLERELMQVMPKSAPATDAAPKHLNGGGGSNGAGGRLPRRLDVLEAYVRSHDKAIRRALEIAARYLDTRKE
jgi:general secretion pathway protein A